MKTADFLMAAQALRVLTETVARYRKTGQMDAEQLAVEWEAVSTRSREVAANLTAALDEAEAQRESDEPA